MVRLPYPASMLEQAMIDNFKCDFNKYASSIRGFPTIKFENPKNSKAVAKMMLENQANVIEMTH